MKHTLLRLTDSYRLSFFFRLFFLRFRERLSLSDDEDEDDSLELVSLSLSSEELLVSRCLFLDLFCFFELDLDLEDIFLEWLGLTFKLLNINRWAVPCLLFNFSFKLMGADILVYQYLEMKLFLLTKENYYKNPW